MEYNRHQNQKLQRQETWKKILNMYFSAIGDKHSNCDDGWCSLVYVKIYKGKNVGKQ